MLFRSTLKPYGTSYVNILTGLSGGETLKALSTSSISGRLKNNKQSSNSNKQNNNDSGGMGGPGGGGGFGGPPGM